MGKYCLPKNIADSFKKLLNEGKVDVEGLAKMSSEQRHNYFSTIVGEENATNVNGLLEKNLLGKNFYKGLITWAKTIIGITPQVRKDLISKIEKMTKDKWGNLLSPEEEKNFMQDLIETKLGLSLSVEEGKNITLLSNKMAEARAIFEKTGKGEQYGATKSALERFLSTAKKKGTSDWSWNPLKMIEYIASNAKALAASLDNSFALRQGIKTLFTHPIIWTKNFLKSFGDLAKGFKNGRDDVIDGIKAEVYGRKNSISGLYDRMKIDIGGIEEAYPGNLGEKIPLFKNLYRASEAAYEGMGMRLRADLADKLAEKALKQGVDLTDKIQAESIGKLINSLTGRGSIGKLNVIGKEINATFFSIKFLKGNWDTLTMHTFGTGLKTSFARKEAALNLVKIIGSVAGIMTIADRLWPGSVEFDSYSSDFGKIKIGDTRFDITGGAGSIITLISRMIGGKTKSGGIVKELGIGFGSQTRLDVIESFFEGKLSPIAGLVRDMWKGQDFNGNPVGIKNSLYNTFTPMPIKTGVELWKDPNAAPFLISIIADGLGVSTNTYAPTSTNWNLNPGAELQQFKVKVGNDKFNQANKDYNQKYNEWFKNVQTKQAYKDLSDEEKQSVITKNKAKIKDDIFRQYNFKYKSPPKKTLPKL